MGFLNPGPVPQDILKVDPILPYKAKDEATLSQPADKREEEEKEEEEKKVVEVLDSEDNFEVFNRLKSPKAPISDFSHLPFAQFSQIQEDLLVPEAMGIQHKPKASLMEVMESQVGGKAPERVT